MSIVTLAEHRAFMRELQDAALDPVLQQSLNAAQEQVEHFIGFDLIEFDGDVPASIKQAISTLAMCMTDAMPAEVEQQARAGIERLLRPYRRETGLRAA